ncbi:heterokaryon incompatibility protein-domain-containing protein [Lasiosphaeria hispida]|uniref:Heterokaryon incompatibility protein-domain-containing protein n=1 Tax=Lasiosphaeria hispida TaxID=260671 RepID=A0AAJ0HK81_9PEZI|nr:heterokaryon incompatibility protein-domain-containing protein [Lasiosphaeria hispida]
MAPDTTTSAATEGGGLSQEAVSYSKGTAEWRILNRKLGQLTTRVRRADAHQPTTREWFNKAIEKSGKTIPYVTKSSFRYSKLGDKEIRLLRLYQSKHPDDPLKADLFKRKLDDVDREYEALSYCWGTESADHEIQVRDLNATGPAVRNGTTKPGQENMIDTFRETIGAITHTEFKIRKNLHDALKQLRRKYGDVYLWVDAICIDQSSEGREEKQRQLAMMARIYNSAATVCVWLGEDKGEAEKAFRLARDIMNYKRFDEMIHDRNKMIDWQSLTAIMRADWFSRRWVIQEIALSRNATIHCGEHSLHWDDFADAVSLLVEKIELMRVGFRHELFDDVETSSASILIQTLGNICRKSDEDHDRGAISSRLLDVETLVSTLLAFQATFPRDTIYSILSLAKDFPKSQEAWELLHEEQILETNPIGILPNYGSSPRDLFIAFVTRSIHQTGSLDIICRHWAPDLERIEDGADQMPSWISARSKAPFGLPGTARGRQNGENLVAYLPHDQRRRYSASAVSRNVETGLERGERDGYFDENGGSPRSTEREAETSERGSISGNGIMVVEGFILGIIKSQSDVMRGGIIPGEWVARLGWKKNEENQVPDTLWRLLVADRMAQGARPPLWYKRACLHGLVDQRVTDNAGNIHPVTPVDRKISEQTTTYFKRVESIVWNRRIFELTAFEEKTGGPPIASGSQPARSTAKILPKPMMLYGLGPEESRVDHIVCILYGCSVPVVLKVAEQQRVSGLYEVVGEAYVDGIMDGEFMIEKWTSRAREFRLG